jgi:hypothetical protein
MQAPPSWGAPGLAHQAGLPFIAGDEIGFITFNIAL